eukprot:363145-Chlamydomonas_euryale.AAC.14
MTPPAAPDRARGPRQASARRRRQRSECGGAGTAAGAVWQRGGGASDAGQRRRPPGCRASVVLWRRQRANAQPGQILSARCPRRLTHRHVPANVMRQTAAGTWHMHGTRQRQEHAWSMARERAWDTAHEHAWGTAH